jgi:hypothetical protein
LKLLEKREFLEMVRNAFKSSKTICSWSKAAAEYFPSV